MNDLKIESCAFLTDILLSVQRYGKLNVTTPSKHVHLPVLKFCYPFKHKAQTTLFKDSVLTTQ